MRFARDRGTLAPLLGRALRAWRGDLPLKRVAMDLGVTASAVSRWERGLRFPSGPQLKRISSYTRTPVPCLLCEKYESCDHHRPWS